MAKKEFYKDLPISEDGYGVLCRTRSGNKYKVSQNTSKKEYTLWEVLDSGLRKIKTAKSPIELYDIIDMNS